ncbi:hypothetical protein N9383_02525 [Granulosicoccus sp.]|nr:hypothetical protein [Granulosicoccus sp.]
MAEQAEIKEVSKAIDDGGSGGDTQDLNPQGGVITVAGTCHENVCYVAALVARQLDNLGSFVIRLTDH